LMFARRPLRDPGRGSDIPSVSPQAQIPSNSGTGGAADGSDSTERPMTLANLPVDRVSSTTAVCGGLRFQTLFSLAYDSVQFVW
jgi:hypothetical protein